MAWLETEQLGLLLLSALVGALFMYVWSRRQLDRERVLQREAQTELRAEHRERLEALQLDAADRAAKLEQQLARLRNQCQQQRCELERRLEAQAQLDPHRWLAEARAQRADGDEVGAVRALCAGIERTQDALCEAYLDLALHHFVLRVGVSSDIAVAHLNESERYAQLASLLKPGDRVASLLLEDIAAAMDMAQLRTADVLEPPAVPERREDEFIGASANRGDLARALADEAAASEAAGRFVVAEKLAYRALAITLHDQGEDAAATIAARDVYARALLGKGAYPEAYEEIQRALQACSRSGLAADDRALRLRGLRADVLGRMGRWELAVAELDALLILRQQHAGPLHRETLCLRRERASALSALGHGEAALHEIDATLQALEHLADPEEPDVTLAHAARAQVLSDLGRPDDAMAELDAILPVAERIFGVEHCAALKVRWQSAQALHALDRNDEALDDVEMLLATQERLFGAQHPSALQTAALRARILHALGRREDALEEAKRLLPLHASSFGDDHRETIVLSGLVRALEAA